MSAIAAFRRGGRVQSRCQPGCRRRAGTFWRSWSGNELIFPVRRLAPHGLDAWAGVLKRGNEGLVANDDASPYVGGRTRSWLKVKGPGWTDTDDRWRRVRGL